MARAADKAAAPKDGHKAKPAVSKLGRDLRRLSDKIAAARSLDPDGERAPDTRPCSNKPYARA
jgi:hypothetical protein